MGARTYADIVAEIVDEFPRFSIVEKRQSKMMRLMSFALCFVTSGRTVEFMDSSVTTIGSTVYVPERWNDLPEGYRASTLRHERVHLRQWRKFGFLPFAFLYLLVPLPLGLAWFRAEFEKEAYEESMRADCEIYGVLALRSREYRKGVIAAFTSSAYGWMWPFRGQVERWYDQTAQKILEERLAEVESDAPDV